MKEETFWPSSWISFARIHIDLSGITSTNGLIIPDLSLEHVSKLRPWKGCSSAPKFCLRRCHTTCSCKWLDSENYGLRLHFASLSPCRKRKERTGGCVHPSLLLQRPGINLSWQNKRRRKTSEETSRVQVNSLGKANFIILFTKREKNYNEVLVLIYCHSWLEVVSWLHIVFSIPLRVLHSNLLTATTAQLASEES